MIKKFSLLGIIILIVSVFFVQNIQNVSAAYTCTCGVADISDPNGCAVWTYTLPVDVSTHEAPATPVFPPGEPAPENVCAIVFYFLVICLLLLLSDGNTNLICWNSSLYSSLSVKAVS